MPDILKCKRKYCRGILREIGGGSMGSCHSSYYQCRKCGNKFLIDDCGRILWSSLSEKTSEKP